MHPFIKWSCREHRFQQKSKSDHTHTKSFSREDSSKDCCETDSLSLGQHTRNSSFSMQLLLFISSTDKPVVYCTRVLARHIGELGDLQLSSRTLKIMGYFTFINNKPLFSMTGFPTFLHSLTLKSGLYNF